MALRIRRGLAIDRTSFTPEEGELLHDTDALTLYIGDNATAGGILLAKSSITTTLRTVAASKLMGRGSAGGSGEVQEITLGTGLSMSGTTISCSVVGLTDSDYGDITVSAAGTVMTIDNDAVTYAKIQNVTAASRLLGRGSAGGAGDVQEITLGTGLSMSGTTLNASGAALADADYGDITVSGAGTVMTIDNDVVTFAKMQNIATDRLLGRDAALSGDVEELTVGGGIEFTGAGGIQTSAFTGDVTKSAGGTTTTIANDAVTYAKMQNVSAASRVLGRGSAGGAGDVEELTLGTGLTMSGTTISSTVIGLTDSDYGDITVSASGTVMTIDNNVVTFAKMQDIATDRLIGRDAALSGDPEELTVGGGIEFTGAGGIQTSAFTGDVTKSAGGTTTTIANDAVTYAKMQNVSAASRLLGRGSAGGAGDVEEITIGTGLSMSGTTLSATAAGLSDADYGDITVSGSGTVMTIDNNVVTFAKMQDIATDRLIGRDTAGSGDPQEISVSGGIEWTGSGGIQTSAFTGDVTKSAGGTTTTIANDAVTYAKMQNVSQASRILGRGSAGGAGDVEELSAVNGLTISGTNLGLTTAYQTQYITVTIDGNGSAITAGTEVRTVIPYDCVVTGWYLDSDQTGDIEIDVWVATGAWPTLADTIVGTEIPVINADSVASDTNLTSWNSTIYANDRIAFYVNSCNTIQRAVLKLAIVKT